jgi:bifunctional pyridoxal-dependent enzyme with beta-cystathionase and maltose regulon repressor activities
MGDLCVNRIKFYCRLHSCVAPQGCYVAFANITGRRSEPGLEITGNCFSEQAKVAVVPGLKEWFGDGATGYIRLSFATSAEILNEALFKIKETVSKNR